MEQLMQLRYTLWGPFSVLFILITGIYLTVRTGFVQLWCFPRLLRSMRDKRSRIPGAMTPLQALFTSLGGTLGVGNLAGVALAITLGGPGAVFYMILAAFFGMATKFAEITLSVRFRIRQDGLPLGGPMVYLARGAYHPHLARFFSICCIIASFGTGAMTQSGAIAAAVCADTGLSPVLVALVTAFAVYLVLAGGSTLIARTSSILVPAMTLLYLAGSILVLASHHERIVPALSMIFTGALDPFAAGGGILGALTSHAVADGFSKGIFSNEAGMGSSPIAHGCADSKSPCDQGLLGAAEVFIDTCVVCLLTALVILTSGVLESGAQGLTLTTHAFASVLGPAASVFIGVIVCFLAFSTIIGWSFYGLACLRYLTGGNGGQKLYFGAVTVSVALAALFPLNTLLIAADIVAAMMIFPNLIGLWTLAPIISQETRLFRSKK